MHLVSPRVVVDGIGGHLPQVDHVSPGRHDAFAQGAEEAGAARPAVAADGDGLRTDAIDEGYANTAIELRIELAGVSPTTNVVSLENGEWIHNDRV
jgi:hypothetical protein